MKWTIGSLFIQNQSKRNSLFTRITNKVNPCTTFARYNHLIHLIVVHCCSPSRRIDMMRYHDDDDDDRILIAHLTNSFHLLLLLISSYGFISVIGSSSPWLQFMVVGWLNHSGSTWFMVSIIRSLYNNNHDQWNDHGISFETTHIH